MQKTNMSQNQRALKAEMETMQNIRKLTPEERRNAMFRELREMEMERRQRIATAERKEREAERLKRQKEKDEEDRRRQDAKQREGEEERKKKEKLQQVKRERLRWKELMMVEEMPIAKPQTMLRKPRKAQQERQEDLENQENQGQRRTTQPQFNNWVGEQTKELPQTDFTCRLSAEAAPLKSDIRPKTSKPLRWIKEKLNFGHSSEKTLEQMEKKRQASRLRERYGKLEACKDGRRSHLSQQIDGYSMSRNKILKKSLC